MKPHFFRSHVQLGWTEKPIIRTNHGVTTWTLKNNKPVKFAYKIISLNNTNNKKDIDLKTCVYQETKPDETRIVFRAPKAGTYLCKFYAKSLEPEVQSKHLTEIVEYKVEVKEPAHDAAPLPQCSHTVWGPGIKSRKVTNVSSIFQAIMVVSNVRKLLLYFSCFYPLKTNGIVHSV